MRNIAHRGASAYAPENTTAAFDLAIEMGADAIETDVQLTRDRHLVLFHDSNIERTSSGKGRIDDYMLVELQALDVGAWFGTEFAGSRILTVQEALEAYLDRIPFVLEIKDPAAAILMIESIPVTDRIEITSFDWEAVIAAKNRVPHFSFGFLTPRFDESEIERCVASGLQQICPHADVVSSELVNVSHRRGLNVRAWGVSKREQIAHLSTSGVDGTTCNWPDWLT